MRKPEEIPHQPDELEIQMQFESVQTAVCLWNAFGSSSIQSIGDQVGCCGPEDYIFPPRRTGRVAV